MPLDNCKQCGRLFQKTFSDLCRGCYAYSKSQNMEIYRHIQENPGITMMELSQKFNTSVRDIESLIFSGVLGTANQLVRSYCALCKCEMTFVNRVGYFCYRCNSFVEKEAGAGRYSETQKRLDNIRNGHSAFYKPVPEESPSSLKAWQERENERAKRSRRQPILAKYGFKRISDTRR